MKEWPLTKNAKDVAPQMNIPATFVDFLLAFRQCFKASLQNYFMRPGSVIISRGMKEVRVRSQFISVT